MNTRNNFIQGMKKKSKKRKKNSPLKPNNKMAEGKNYIRG